MNQPDYTVIFELLEDRTTSEEAMRLTLEESRETSDIVELSRFAEALSEPEPSCFMMA